MIRSCKNIQDEPELNRSKGESMSTAEVGRLVVNYILIFSYTAPFFFYLNFLMTFCLSLKTREIGGVCVYSYTLLLVNNNK